MTNLATLINYLAKLIIVLGIVIGICSLASDVQAQQGGTVVYGYDANGRLTSVTLPTGETVTYTYDPAGNITGIQRLTGPGPQFLSFAPQSGFVDDIVTFTGANFGTVSSVSFNGTPATVFSGNLTQVTATVPSGATTGQIIVTLSNGTFTTSTFTVLTLQVNPSQSSVLPRQTQQFNAIVPSQLGNTSVTWSINGINGGNSTVGTISSAGLYSAPNITNIQTFTVRATSVARPTLFAQATVKVSSDLFQAKAFLTVQYKPELLISQSKVALLSILKGIFNAPTQTIKQVAPPLSVSSAPVISSISPTTLARATTNTITINGANLFGTTALVFLNSNDGRVTTGVTVSNIVVAADGNSLTATVVVSSGASTGTKVVIISGASTGHSSTSNLSNNTISITP